MDLFAFIGWAAALIVFVTLPWPLNVPIMVLAYRVSRGTAQAEFEIQELWMRSALAALGLGALSTVLLLGVYLLVQSAGFPVGPVLLVWWMLYLPAGVVYLFWAFALDDGLQALGLLLIYLLLPGLPLWLIGWIAGLWRALPYYAPWLFSPSQ